MVYFSKEVGPTQCYWLYPLYRSEKTRLSTDRCHFQVSVINYLLNIFLVRKEKIPGKTKIDTESMSNLRETAALGLVWHVLYHWQLLDLLCCFAQQNQDTNIIEQK